MTERKLLLWIASIKVLVNTKFELKKDMPILSFTMNVIPKPRLRLLFTLPCKILIRKKRIPQIQLTISKVILQVRQHTEAERKYLICLLVGTNTSSEQLGFITRDEEQTCRYVNMFYDVKGEEMSIIGAFLSLLFVYFISYIYCFLLRFYFMNKNTL